MAARDPVEIRDLKTQHPDHCEWQALEQRRPKQPGRRVKQGADAGVGPRRLRCSHNVSNMAESGNVPDHAYRADHADSADNTDHATRVAEPGTVRSLLERGWAQLAGGSESSRLDAEILLAHALRQPRSYLLAHDDEPVDVATIARYQSLLARCAQGEPLAYLTGEREFWSLPLTVTPEVLIPRPETELAVERCLALRDATPAAVADLGTGSGAIALALGLE